MELEELPVLSKKKIEQLQKQPIIEAQLWKSEDGKWLVHETRIVDIKPLAYLVRVLGDN